MKDYLMDTNEKYFINTFICYVITIRRMKTENHEKTQIWGILSLISGIIAILSFLLIFNMSIIFSILAVIFSIVQKQYKFTTAAKAGLILGILGIIIYVIVGYTSFGGPYFANGTLTN